MWRYDCLRWPLVPCGGPGSWAQGILVLDFVHISIDLLLAHRRSPAYDLVDSSAVLIQTLPVLFLSIYVWIRRLPNYARRLCFIWMQKNVRRRLELGYNRWYILLPISIR